MKTSRSLRLSSLIGVSTMVLLGLAGVASAQAAPVPEIDPSSAASGLVLIAGGVVLIMEQLRRR
jgi:hypothetical protein